MDALSELKAKINATDRRTKEGMIEWRDQFIANSLPDQRTVVQFIASNIKKTRRMPSGPDADYFWEQAVINWLSAEIAERRLFRAVEIQARWDQRRMERATAKATGGSRRQGRL